MLRPILAVFATSLALAGPLLAQSQARIQPLYDALALPELVEIMREEGIGYGTELEQELFPRRGGEAWAETVQTIYSLDRMERAIMTALDAELSEGAIEEITEFFESEAGQQIVAYEVAARRALMDEAVEEAASVGWMEMQSEGGDRWDLLAEFAETNDLIESNVAGAMTSNYAFYMGLVDGQAFDFEMTENDVLMDVWSQEQDIREETTDWVYSFTSLAYQPLTDEEFRAYVEFTATPEGQALNAALFSSFNALFADISRDLGLGASRFLSGQDI